MKLHIHIFSLKANLPLEDSQISFAVSNKNTLNPLSDQLSLNLQQQHVLMSDTTEITLNDIRFIIEVENPEEPKFFQLSVLATSISTSKVVLLGRVPIDPRKHLSHQIQNGLRQTIKEPLLGVNNQKGTLTFEIQAFQPQIYSSHRNLKSSESLDKEQTCSSDSYEANLKDLNKTTSSDESEDFSPKFKQSLENHYRNVDYTQKIILEEIDLEDDQDSDIYEMKGSKSSKNYEEKLRVKRKPKDNFKKRLLEERLQIQMDLHNLQESDFFLIRMEQKLRVFA